MTIAQTIAIFEALTVVVLSEPVLNRMSPCAPLLVRLSVHAICAGSLFRIYHLLDGHDPSWSSLVQLGGFTALLLLDQVARVRKVDRIGKHFEPAEDLRGPPTESE